MNTDTHATDIHDATVTRSARHPRYDRFIQRTREWVIITLAWSIMLLFIGVSLTFPLGRAFAVVAAVCGVVIVGCLLAMLLLVFEQLIYVLLIRRQFQCTILTFFKITFGTAVVLALAKVGIVLAAIAFILFGIHAIGNLQKFRR